MSIVIEIWLICNMCKFDKKRCNNKNFLSIELYNMNRLTIIFGLLLIMNTIKAQYSINTAGIDVICAKGSTNISIGEILYSSKGKIFYIYEGTQNANNIYNHVYQSLKYISIYPNPTNDKIYINISPNLYHTDDVSRV